MSDKTKAMVMAIVGTILFFVSFVFLLGAVLLQEYGVPENVVTAVALVGFFGCDGLAVFLLIKSLPGVTAIDIARLDKQYQEQRLSELSQMIKFL